MRGPAARPIIIAAGGTGGHFFPAEALASVLIARGHRIVLMTDARAAARPSAVFAGHEQHVLHGAGIAGRGLARAGRALLSLAAGTLQARRLLAKLDAAAVVGFGGYPCVPPILAARMLRRRPAIVLHEQNAVLGRANRFLAARADLLALGFKNTSGVPKGIATLVIGNPVRAAIAALAGTTPPMPAARVELLVLGGSLGARVFGDVVPAAVAMLPHDVRTRLHVVQQCRKEDIDRVRCDFASADVAADVAPFFHDVADRLAAAHVVISRAGASTCAEIAVVGRAAILVPLPGAIDDHQSENARALTGASIIRQADFTAEHLAGALHEMVADPARLVQAARLAASAAQPHAAETLADAVEQLVASTETSR